MPAYVMRGEGLDEEINVNFYFEFDNFILVLRMDPLLCGSDEKNLNLTLLLAKSESLSSLFRSLQ